MSYVFTTSVTTLRRTKTVQSTVTATVSAGRQQLRRDVNSEGKRHNERAPVFDQEPAVVPAAETEPSSSPDEMTDDIASAYQQVSLKLARRHLCAACPPGASLPKNNNNNNNWSGLRPCCPITTRTIVKARTTFVFKTVTRRSTKTVTINNMVTVKGSLYSDLNGNGVYDPGVDSVVANMDVFLIGGLTKRGLRLGERAISVLARTQTSNTGNFTLTGAATANQTLGVAVGNSTNIVANVTVGSNGTVAGPPIGVTLPAIQQTSSKTSSTKSRTQTATQTASQSRTTSTQSDSQTPTTSQTETPSTTSTSETATSSTSATQTNSQTTSETMTTSISLTTLTTTSRTTEATTTKVTPTLAIYSGSGSPPFAICSFNAGTKQVSACQSSYEVSTTLGAQSVWDIAVSQGKVFIVDYYFDGIAICDLNAAGKVAQNCKLAKFAADSTYPVFATPTKDGTHLLVSGYNSKYYMCTIDYANKNLTDCADYAPAAGDHAVFLPGTNSMMYPTWNSGTAKVYSCLMDTPNSVNMSSCVSQVAVNASVIAGLGGETLVIALNGDKMFINTKVSGHIHVCDLDFSTSPVSISSCGPDIATAAGINSPIVLSSGGYGTMEIWDGVLYVADYHRDKTMYCDIVGNGTNFANCGSTATNGVYSFRLVTG